MEYIQDKIFYHIHRINSSIKPWEVGTNLFFGKQQNEFFKYYDAFDYPSLEGKEPNIGNLHGILNDYIIYARETIFEEIRSNYFPQLPSRLNCLWVIPQEENINFWKNALIKNNQLHQILKLKCSGKLFKANQKFLGTHIGKFDYFREKAFRYWSGLDTKEESDDIEYSFQGFITVEKIISSSISEN